MTTLLDQYMRYKYYVQGRLTSSQIDVKLNQIIPITVEACMMALYARLRVLNQLTGDYASRFATRPTYSKSIDLPLPFADAIQQFGRITTQCMRTNHKLIPTYHENVEQEGRKDHVWRFHKYESIMPILKGLGIPQMHVDTRDQDGSAWWTYRPVVNHGTVDFKCILPFLHYSNHSAMLALMFYRINEAKDGVDWIITHKDDDLDYDCRMKEILNGSNLRAFSGLCHATSEEWNRFGNIH